MQVVPTPDFRRYPTDPAVTDAQVEDGWLRVSWADGESGRFHFFWLRDNAADDHSIDPHSHERLFDILDFSLDLRPRAVRVEDGVLTLDWGDRVTRYHPGWLRAYCYDLGASDDRKPLIETWDGRLADRWPRFDAAAVSNDPATRLAWLQAIRRFGIALVSDSPIDPREYIDWLESLLLIRDMNWGKHYDVIYNPEGKYISDKGVVIPPHNDAATRPHMPGLQIFHCVENTVEGGESCWVDGFHVAECLRREAPADFELLASQPWAMANRHRDTEYFCREPFIVLDRDGELQAIRHTHWLREPLLGDFERIEPLYRAYRRYVEIANDAANQLRYRLQPGDVSFIDNPRVFHARGAYVDGAGLRHMQVAYSEREEVDAGIAALLNREHGR